MSKPDDRKPDDHDQLCPMAGQTSREIYALSIPCECEPIAQVRADERRKVAVEFVLAIEAEAERLFRDRRRASLGQGLLTAATIARRVGGAS